MGDTTFRVLLVDDEPVIRELVRTMLSEPGVEVEVAPDAMECLRATRTQRFDMVLLDIMLPGMDGITACRILKADPKTSTIAVYMLTAKAKAADVEAAKRAGADGYINKPFRGVELMETVNQLRKLKAP